MVFVDPHHSPQPPDRMQSTAVCILVLLVAVANSRAANIKYPILPAPNSRSMVPEQWNTKDPEGRTHFGYAHYGQAASNVLDADGHMEGAWSYLNPEGALVQASYTADEQGFNVVFNNLPVVVGVSPVGEVQAEDDAAILPKTDPDQASVVADESVCTSNELRSRMLVNANATFKMTESEEATPNQYPFLVSLVRGSVEDEDLDSFCGGSLITEDKVLTAAHCITKDKTETLIPKEAFHVILGVHTISSTGSDSTARRKIKHMVIHEGYMNTTIENDLAILTLDSPVKYTGKIQPICLTPECFDSDETSPIAMGWGLTDSKGKASEYVRHAVLPVVSNQECQITYGERDNIFDSMLCAYRGEQDACQGDSGGPLVLDFGESVETCRFMQIGVVSYGRGDCGKTTYPGIYTRVSSYMDWLNNNL